MPKRKVFLTFPSEKTREPIIYRLIKETECIPNIRKANVGHHEAWMILEIEAETEEKLEEGILCLKNMGISVERLEGDVVGG